ncbi:MAG: DUF3536 domain-containing protein [Thermodesulfobacteriota bacterium]
MRGYVTIHGHFYQPPRESPWLEIIERQDSAAPYHDWNERVHAEAYAPNSVARILNDTGQVAAIVNNYEGISFNFGPTLLGWIRQHDAATYQRIRAADRASSERLDGHGNAIAQAYNHMIMPLANRRDKITQVRWGIADFRSHFGRLPEGMWLPETAVDLETLEILHEEGIAFTILAPNQARRVRTLAGRGRWQDVSGGRVDTSRPYAVRLPCGGSLAVFFYHGAIAHDIAFGGLLADGSRLAGRLQEALPAAASPVPPLVHVATDGESYGHHHRFGDMGLAFVLAQLADGEDLTLTSYGHYLSLHPPTQEVEVFERSSWSCAHGVERWRADCGCSSGGHPGWNQAWRAPLRETLDWLRFELTGIFQQEAKDLLADPWAARDDAIDLLLEPGAASRIRFLQRHAARPLAAGEEARAFRLLEMQRQAMLMFTSCGWFFDELSGIETVQILRYAGRALELAEGLSGASLTEPFLGRLVEAESNLAEMGDGAAVFRRFVLPGRFGPAEAAGHAGLAMALDGECRGAMTFGCYQVEIRSAGEEPAEAPGPSGLVTVRHSGLGEEATFFVLGVGPNGHEGGAEVHVLDAPAGGSGEAAASLAPIIRRACQVRTKEGVAAALAWLKTQGGRLWTVADLHPELRQELLSRRVEGCRAHLEGILAAAFREHAGLLTLLRRAQQGLPAIFRLGAEVAFRESLVSALSAPERDSQAMARLVADLADWQIPTGADWLAPALEAPLTAAMAAMAAAPSQENLGRALAIVSLITQLQVPVSMWQAQNLFAELLAGLYPARHTQAAAGDRKASGWLKDFLSLGHALGLDVEALVRRLA